MKSYCLLNNSIDFTVLSREKVWIAIVKVITAHNWFWINALLFLFFFNCIWTKSWNWTWRTDQASLLKERLHQKLNSAERKLPFWHLNVSCAISQHLKKLLHLGATHKEAKRAWEVIVYCFQKFWHYFDWTNKSKKCNVYPLFKKHWNRHDLKKITRLHLEWYHTSHFPLVSVATQTVYNHIQFQVSFCSWTSHINILFKSRDKQAYIPSAYIPWTIAEFCS